MKNLSLEELRLITQIRNTGDYENKSKEILIQTLREPKPKSKIEPKAKPKLEPKPEIRINKKKLEDIRKDFYKLRHKFCKK